MRPWLAKLGQRARWLAIGLLGAGILRRYGHPGLSVLFATLAVWGAKQDVQFMEVFARHLKHKSLLDV